MLTFDLIMYGIYLTILVLVSLGQAMEIGAPAISFLIDTWEGHLTPPEAASIADRASRGCDPNIVSAAAELALSCLPHSHALNPNEIQRAILQVSLFLFLFYRIFFHIKELQY